MKAAVFFGMLMIVSAFADNFMVEVASSTSSRIPQETLKGLTRAQRRQRVFDVLSKNAEASQRNLLDFFTERGLKTKSFWISNRILVEDMPIELFDVLNQRFDVISVRREAIAHAIEHEVQASVSEVMESQWNIELVRAPEAWEISEGQGVTVGVIDTGARHTHEALVDAYRGNQGGSFSHDYHFYDPRGNAVGPEDGNGHGTHCTGSICGSKESGIGVAPGAKWIASKGCATILCLESDLLDSAQFMVCPTRMNGTDPDCSMGADVVSNSWGGGQGDNWYRDSVMAWRDAGMIPVFAQGNSGPVCGSANSPGDMDVVIGVGATDSNNTLALFSSRGPGLGVTGFPEIKPDISAPGAQIRSASNRADDLYATLSGTSMACPHISGVVALMLGANPDMTYDQVYDVLTGTAITDLPEPTGQSSCGGVSYTTIPNNHYGYGAVDAFEAVTQAKRLAL